LVTYRKRERKFGESVDSGDTLNNN
jgi:hypothetical protein